MDALHPAAERAFPDRVVTDVTEQNTPRNEVAYITFENHSPAYIKIATDCTRRLTREIAATHYAAMNTPIEVPIILDADPTGSRPYLATTPLPGTPLHDPWTSNANREPLLHAAGQTLVGVHDTRFDQPGRIQGGDPTGLELTDETWTETLCETVRWRAEDWFADRFRDLPPKLIDTLHAAQPLLDDVTPCLLHGDCSRINVHLDPEGLLDWERALVGDPAFDLVDTHGHLINHIDVDDTDRRRLTDAFYSGYRDHRGHLPTGLDEREPIYRAFAQLLVPQTFEAWAPTVDTPAEDLATQVREEFTDRLATARATIQ